jgi:hypothetical protein
MLAIDPVQNVLTAMQFSLYGEAKIADFGPTGLFDST